MICDKCKNPINDNSAVCEWCGASCVSSKVNNATESIFSNDDAELLSLCKKLRIKDAILLCQKNNGLPRYESIEYVKKLYYFSTNKHAAEYEYKKKLLKRKRGLKWLRVLAIFLLPIIALFGFILPSIEIFRDNYSAFERVLWVLLFICTSAILYFGIIWFKVISKKIRAINWINGNI